MVETLHRLAQRLAIAALLCGFVEACAGEDERLCGGADCGAPSAPQARDGDGDGVIDAVDNCPAVFNPAQADVDGDRVGDLCERGAVTAPVSTEEDWDGDGIPNTLDNCPEVINRAQLDANGDGVGDACQARAPLQRDSDGDGVFDDADNCPWIANAAQTDTNRDGLGDACQGGAEDAADSDRDGVPDARDNCPWMPNDNQSDANGDGVGDACQPGVQPAPDGDEDGVPDARDNCPELPNPDQLDANGDGVGDACQSGPQPAPDGDEDGVPDARDNCPELPNPDQADINGDGLGDACAPLLVEEGTVERPLIIPGDPDAPDFMDERDTTQAPSDRFDSYPPNDTNEAGPEFIYVLQLRERVALRAFIEAPEPEGVDVDVHLLAAIEPLVLIERGHHEVTADLAPGRYYLALDTYVSQGVEMPGPYRLTVQLERIAQSEPVEPIEPVEPGDWAGVGTCEDPLILGEPLQIPSVIRESRDTRSAPSDAIDVYPPSEVDESGPEYIYTFTLDRAARLSAMLAAPEPDGVDIDVHLLDALAPIGLLQRSNTGVSQLLQPGRYYLALDTYVSGSGVARPGRYDLTLRVDEPIPTGPGYFNDYILAAVDELATHYALLGYDSSVLTHDIPYGDHGTISRSGGARTMCVAAVLEVILTAMNLYAEQTGDDSVFDFLPQRSWERLGANDFKAHVWVNHELNSGGTADALRNFGMGEVVPFEALTPGSFINLNRTNGTGHAVVFLAYLDIEGNELPAYSEAVIGFKYFSAQGGYEVGAGGLDFRWAVFDPYGRPEMPGRRDATVIESNDQRLLNTGVMWSPDRWVPIHGKSAAHFEKGDDQDVSAFDPDYFTGQTIDDP
ncbi:thrombospondin type 3 repeat-containing protein [Myxococcota bacterium]|nr:thrombospondin type 3 repeat-containing protein [Myxococcota bacterium]